MVLYNLHSTSNQVRTQPEREWTPTYNVKEAVIHATEVGLNSLKERSGLRSRIREYNPAVQTNQVILEILEKLD